MAISDKITSIQNHLKDDWDSVESLIGDTELDKNIENISSALDDLYNDLPKVTGSGTSITLDDTRKGRLESTLSGNTSQSTTTGKNKLDLTGITARTLQAGVTITPNFEGNLLKNIKISGTPTTTAWQSMKTFTLGAGTYILSGINVSDTTKTGLRIGLYIDSSRQWFITSNSPTYTFTLSETTTCQFVIWVQSATDFPTTDTYATPMIRLSSVSDTTYEPYTNGVSPNPDFPQEVHVVRGDNEITVCSKNLFDKSKESEKYLINSAGTLTPNNDYNSSDFINIKFSTSIVLSTNTTSAILEIVEYDKNKSLINRGVKTNSNFYTLTTNVNTKYVRISYQNTSTQTQLEYGSSSTTYEPCSSNTYNINLPVENLWGGFSNSFTRTDLGVQFIANTDGTITASGTATNVATSILLAEATANGIYKSLPKGTYTVSGGGTNYTIEVYDKDNVVRLAGIAPNSSSASFTISNTTNVVLRVQVTSGATINKTIKLQLEAGDKANSYTPYGTTPIELGLISTYKDKLIRTSGKNLFDKDDIYEANKIIQTDGAITSTQNFDLYKAIVQPNASYTLSITNTSGTNRDCRIVAFTSNGTYIQEVKTFSVNANVRSTSTFTTPANTSYILYHILKTNSDVQLEKGTTATDYEPYGSGEWYTHKEIGKKVYDGSEYFGYGASGETGISVINTGGIGMKQGNYLGGKSNYFMNNQSGKLVNTIRFGANDTNIWIYISSSDFTSADDFKTWVSTHNTIVYYLLETPTNTKITYEPLLEQLEAYYHAKSRATQTNISQENNDLPFEIDASALKEWSV